MSDITIESLNKKNHLNTKAKPSSIIGRRCTLTLNDAKQIANNTHAVNIHPDSYSAMEESHQFLKARIDQRFPIYGINTHFGDQVNLLDSNLKNIDPEPYYHSITERQTDLIKSHTCGLGAIVEPEIVRVAMTLRAHCLSQGYSGITKGVVDSIVAFINAGITPIIRRYGSIGASGDLIPLASIAAGIIGENVDVLFQNEVMKAPQAIILANLKKFKPELRDGLAMINGTSYMTAIAAISAAKLQRLFGQMLNAIAMTLESMLVITSAYHPLVHQLKGQSGQITISEKLMAFWKDSKLTTDLDELRQTHLNNTEGSRPVQDYYSLRSVAQGFGPFQENLTQAITWIENEMNSVNDNPIIDLAEGKIHHNANFMGYYITEACDLLKMDIAQASTWIHALLANLVHPRKNHNLPANIVSEPGKQNGFRPIQLLAASITVQNRKLAQSQQAFMIPTEGDNQDVNSLGTHAAYDFQESVANLERLTAILLLAATQALEFRGINNASKASQTIYKKIRKHSPSLADCRPMSEEIQAIIQLMEAEQI